MKFTMSKKNEKMKFIDFLVRKNGTLSEKFTLRKNRLTRAVKAAIDSANEQSLDANINAEKAIENIKYNLDNSNGIMNCLNDYLDFMEEKEGFDRAEKHLKELQRRLDEEVEVENEIDDED